MEPGYGAPDLFYFLGFEMKPRLMMYGMTACGFLLAASNANADLPKPTQRPEIAGVHADSIAMSYTAQQELQARLAKSVYLVYARQPRQNSLASDDIVLDGAAVAIRSEAIQDIMPKDDALTEDTSKPANKGSGFFNSGLESVSSPFHKPPEPQKKFQSKRQYFLTTADWLTMSDAIEIVVQQRRIQARLDYRDDAQNVALLSIEKTADVQSVDVYADIDLIPGIVYVVLNPGSVYERMTQHVLNVEEENRYGTANMQARNGYPLFDETGRLVGLSVGPEPSRRFTRIVHPKLLDMAIHPAKYSRERIEKIEPVAY